MIKNKGKKRRRIIKVAPRPEVIRKRYKDFLAGLEKYLGRTKQHLEEKLRGKQKDNYFLAE